jgi:phosphohistidine phosphatase
MANDPIDPAGRLVYLVQHGEAEPKTVDPQRPLTASGRATVERVAAWAGGRGLQPDEIRHSGKLRARQTAEILAEKLRPPRGVVEAPSLAPNDDVRPVAEALAESPFAVMMVGHLPFLARLAGLMSAGDADREIVRFHQAGLIGLLREDDRWAIVCVVPPQLVGEP